MITRRPLTVLLAALASTCAATAACNAITDTGKYELVDCPNGACGDGGSTTADANAGTDASSVDGAADSGEPPPLPDCGANRAPLRLVVTGSTGSVSSNPGGLSVPAGSTETACFAIDRIELRTSGPSATWTGASCKDGSRGDRCELELSAGGLTVTAALP